MDNVPLEDLPLEVRRRLPHNSPILDDYARRVEEQYGLPGGWLLAIKNAGERSESVGRMSVSPKGARGVMQFMPGTAKRFGLQDPTDPLASIEAAGKYGAFLKTAVPNGDPLLMAAAYNAGEDHPGIKNGRLPAETMAYIGRVKSALDPNGGLAEVPLADLPPDLVAPRAEPVKPEPMEANPTEGMSFLEKAAAGFGKSYADLGLGLKELVGIVSPQEVDEAAKLDQPLMDTGAGVFGNVLGQASQMILPAGMLFKGMGALRALAPASRAAKAVTSLPAQAAILGGSYSAISPVLSDSSRPLNTAIGAGAALAGDRVLAGARHVVAPAWDALTPPVQDLARKAMDQYKIPLRAAQISESPALKWSTKVTDMMPFSGSQKKFMDQTEAVSSRLSETVGQKGSNLTESLRKARDQLGQTYRQIEGRNSAMLTPQNVTNMTHAANAVVPFDTTEKKTVVQSLHQLIDHAIDVADPQTGAIPGEVYAALRRDLKKAASHPSTLPKAKEAYEAIQRELDDAFQRGVAASGNPFDLDLLRQTDHRWANMRTLEELLPSGGEDAAPNLTRLSSVLRGKTNINRANRNAMLYGQGDQTLPDLARISSGFLKDDIGPAPSVLGRIPVRDLVRTGEVAGAGASLYAMNMHEDSPAMDTAADLGALFLATKLGGSALNSRWFARGLPRTTQALDVARALGAAQVPAAYARTGLGALKDAPPSPEMLLEVPEEDLPGGGYGQ